MMSTGTAHAASHNTSSAGHPQTKRSVDGRRNRTVLDGLLPYVELRYLLLLSFSDSKEHTTSLLPLYVSLSVIWAPKPGYTGLGFGVAAGCPVVTYCHLSLPPSRPMWWMWDHEQTHLHSVWVCVCVRAWMCLSTCIFECSFAWTWFLHSVTQWSSWFSFLFIFYYLFFTNSS